MATKNTDGLTKVTTANLSVGDALQIKDYRELRYVTKLEKTDEGIIVQWQSMGAIKGGRVGGGLSNTNVHKPRATWQVKKGHEIDIAAVKGYEKVAKGGKITQAEKVATDDATDELAAKIAAAIVAALGK